MNNLSNDFVEIFNKLKYFEDFLTPMDCHANDFFTQNERYCDAYQCKMIYNEIGNNWEFSNGNTFGENFLRTKHVCLTKELFNQFKIFNMKKPKGRLLMADPISLSIIALITLTSAAPHMRLIFNKLQTIFKLTESEGDSLARIDIIQNQINRMVAYYRNLIPSIAASASVPLPIRHGGDTQDILNNSGGKEKKIVDEIEGIIPFLDKKNNNPPPPDEDNGDNEIPRNSDDFLIILPPLDYNKKIKISNTKGLEYLLNWSVYQDVYKDIFYDKRFKIDTIYTFLKTYHKNFDIDLEDIVDVVDKRNLSKNAARMTIFISFD